MSNEKELLKALQRSLQYIRFAIQDSREHGHIISAKTAEQDLEFVKDVLARARGEQS